MLVRACEFPTESESIRRMLKIGISRRLTHSGKCQG